MDPITVSIGAAAGLVRFAYRHREAIILAKTRAQHAIKDKIQKIEHRDFLLSAGVLSNENGELVNELVKEWMQEPIRLDFIDSSLRENHFLQEAFDYLVPACGLVRISSKGIPLIGNGTQIGWQVVKLENPLSERQNEHNDTFLFREKMKILLEDYHQKHSDKTSVSEALVTVLDNYLQLFLTLIDEAKNIPGEENKGAIEILEKNINTLIDNFQNGPAKERQYKFFNYFASYFDVTKTGRDLLCNAIRPKLKIIIDKAKREQKAHSLQHTAKDLVIQTEILNAQVEKFIRIHNSKDKLDGILKKQAEWIANYNGDDPTQKSVESACSHAKHNSSKPAIMAADNAIISINVIMALAANAKKIIERHGEALSEKQHDDLVLTLILIDAFSEQCKNQFFNHLVPSAEKEVATISKFQYLDIGSVSLSYGIAEELSKIDEKLGHTKRDSQEILKNMMQTAGDNEPDSVLTANIAFLCLERPILKNKIIEFIKNYAHTMSSAVVTQIENQIAEFNRFQQKKLSATFDEKFVPLSLIKKGVVKINRVSNEIVFKLIQSQDDFKSVIQLLEQNQKENLNCIAELKMAARKIFQKTSINRSLPAVKSKDRRDSIQNNRLLIEFQALYIKRYAAHSIHNDDIFYYDCGHANKIPEYLIERGIVRIEERSGAKIGKIYLKKVEVRQDFGALINLLISAGAINHKIISKIEEYKSRIFYLSDTEKRALIILKQFYPALDIALITAEHDILDKLKGDQVRFFSDIIFALQNKKSVLVSVNAASEETIANVIADIDAPSRGLFSAMNLSQDDLQKPNSEIVFHLIDMNIIKITDSRKFYVNFDHVKTDIAATLLAHFLNRKCHAHVSTAVDTVQSHTISEQQRVIKDLFELSSLSKNEKMFYTEVQLLLKIAESIINKTSGFAQELTKADVIELKKLTISYKENAFQLSQKLPLDIGEPFRRKLSEIAVSTKLMIESYDQLSAKHNAEKFNRLKKSIADVLLVVLEERRDLKILKKENNCLFWFISDKKGPQLNKLLLQIDSANSLSQLEFASHSFIRKARAHQLSLRRSNSTDTMKILLQKLSAPHTEKIAKDFLLSKITSSKEKKYLISEPEMGW